MRDRQAPRPGVGDVDHGQARRVVVALDRDDEARVVDPHRARRPRRACAAGRRPPARATRGRRRRRRRSRRPGRGAAACRPSTATGSRPVVRRSGAPPPSRSSSQTSEVSAVGLDEDRASGRRTRQRMRPRRLGDRLQAPVRRRLDVLARAARARPRARPCRPTSTQPSQPSSRPVRNSCTSAPIVVEVVAALLDDDGGQAAARRAPARRRGSRRRVTCSGLSGSPPAASTPSATTSARGAARPPRQRPHGREPVLVAGARAPAAGCGWRRRRVSLREAEEVREPAGARVDVDRADEHVGVARRRSPGCRCRDGRRRRARPPDRRARRAGGRRRRRCCSGSRSRRSSRA